MSQKRSPSSDPCTRLCTFLAAHAAPYHMHSKCPIGERHGSSLTRTVLTAGALTTTDPRMEPQVPAGRAGTALAESAEEIDGAPKRGLGAEKPGIGAKQTPMKRTRRKEVKAGTRSRKQVARPVEATRVRNVTTMFGLGSLLGLRHDPNLIHRHRKRSKPVVDAEPWAPTAETAGCSLLCCLPFRSSHLLTAYTWQKTTLPGHRAARKGFPP